MNLDIIKGLGIETEDFEEILAELQALQDDYLDQVEYIDDEEERSDIEEKIKTIKEQIDLIKAEPPKKSSLIAVEEEEKKNIPIAVSEKELRKEEAKADKKKAKREEDHQKELQAEADKLIKENAANKKAEDKAIKDKIKDDKKAVADTPASSSSTDTSGAGTSGAAASVASGDIAKGIAEYAKSDYTNAYATLNAAVNDAKNSRDPQLGMAEYLLAQMYKNGQGVPNKDKQRAEFWFEKAAEHKNPHAALETGISWGNRTPGSVAEADEIIKKSLKYFELAVDNSALDPKLINIYKDAMDKYIQVCESKTVANSHLRQAYDYLDKLVSLEKDAYLKEQIKKRKEALKNSKKAAGSSISSGGASLVMINGVSDGALLVSVLLYIIGAMEMCRGLIDGALKTTPSPLEGLQKILEFKFLAPIDEWGHSYNFFGGMSYKIADIVSDITDIYTEDLGGYVFFAGVSIMMVATAIQVFTVKKSQGRLTRILTSVLSFVPTLIITFGLLTRITVCGQDLAMSILSPTSAKLIIVALVIVLLDLLAAYIVGNIAKKIVGFFI